MTDQAHDVVVVGGGVAGMAAAWALRDLDVILVDSSDRLGGRLLSHQRGEYWLNLGGHLFPGAESAVGDMVGDLGLKTVEIPGTKFDLVWNGKVYSRGRVESYPLTLPMKFTERVAFAITGLRILRAVAKWRRAQTPDGSAPLTSRDGKPATFRSIVGRPPKRVAAVFETAARRASTELDNQSAETAGQLFAGVWAGKKSSLAFNLLGGSGQLAEQMQRRLGRAVLLNCEVTFVQQDADGFVVTLLRDGVSEQLRTRRVVLATPATVSARICPLPEEVRRCLADVSYGDFVSMAALTTETEASAFDDMYAVTTPDCSFDMLFNHANPLRGAAARRPGGSVMVYAGGDRARQMMEWSDEKIAETFSSDIVRLFPQLDGRIAETIVQKWPVGLSYSHPGFDLGPVRRYVAGGAPVQLCGDYFGDLGNMEIAASSGVRAARRVRESLGK